MIKYCIDNKITGESYEYDDRQHQLSEYRHMLMHQHKDVLQASKDIILYDHIT